MKKSIKIFILIVLHGFFLISCLEQYLDKAPESGLTDEEVFTKYVNLKAFFDNVWSGVNRNHNIAMNTLNAALDCCTDFADQGYLMWWPYYKWGPLGDNVGPHYYNSILVNAFKNIRICNIVLKNISRLTDGTQEEINDLTGRAHFIRAFHHFCFFRFWGPMPYLTEPLGPYDQWDIPRLSKHETCIRIAADFDSAAYYFEKAGKMRRDALPGQPGHLNNPEQSVPNGVAAKAMKARALLFAASPLNNELGIIDWEVAAVANWEAIQVALDYGYGLLSATDYKKNYIGTTYTNEQLWGLHGGSLTYTDGITRNLVNGVFSNTPTRNAGMMPTQNGVDWFETKWGDPLNTHEDREIATTLGHYNEQDPFVNRDPRFYIDIIYNTAPIAGYGTAKIYTEVIDGVTYGSELRPIEGVWGITHTGYYMRKYWGDQSVKNQIKPLYTIPWIRLGELYLNYAEAANEAYGPNVPAPGASMSAVDAINFIRNGPGRWTEDEMAPVQSRFTVSTEAFRPRIKNERNVELCWEGHYFFDIRRWMDAPKAYAGPIMGIIPEKVPVSEEYPTGYKYQRAPIPADHQSRWLGDKHYYLPFLTEDYYKMKNFEPGEVW